MTKADWDNLRKNDNPGLDQLAFGYDAIPYAVEKMGYFGIETIIGGKFADAAPKIVKIGQ